jgi:hypothetical protein
LCERIEEFLPGHTSHADMLLECAAGDADSRALLDE